MPEQGRPYFLTVLRLSARLIYLNVYNMMQGGKMNKMKRMASVATLTASLFMGFLRAQDNTQVQQGSAPQPGTTQLSSETEAGTDSTGNFVSQYLFYDHNAEGRRLGISALGRYANVAKSVHRGEFGIGPNIHLKRVQLDTYIGGTTEGILLIDATGVVPLPKGFSVIAVSDFKPPLTSYRNGTKQTTTWYRKDWIGKGHFWFRFEDLYVYQVGEVFAHMGGEVRIHPIKSVELYLNPFFDSQNGKVGLTSGVRVNIK